MKKSLVSICAGTIFAGVASIASPFTAFADVASPSTTQKAIVFNQQLVSKPFGFVHDDTTYMPIWYLSQALDKLNIHSTWHDHTWNLTTSETPDLSNIHPGTGSSSIEVNGHLVQKVNEVVAIDPASGQPTTFMPAWYVIQVLNRLQIHSQWNGTVWQIYTSSVAPAIGNLEIQAATRSPAQRAPSISLGQQIVDYAERFIGVRYQWGGESANGFDCSGLVQTVFAHFGKSLPRTAAEQAQVGTVISKSSLQPGDLVFFNTEGSPFTHVGIYTGHGQFISATSHGVRLNQLDDPYYWGSRFTRATNPGL